MAINTAPRSERVLNLDCINKSKVQFDSESRAQ